MLINRRLIATVSDRRLDTSPRREKKDSLSATRRFAIRKRPPLPDFRRSIGRSPREKDCSSLLGARKNRALAKRDPERLPRRRGQTTTRRERHKRRLARKKLASGCLEAAEINQRGASWSTFAFARRTSRASGRYERNKTAPGIRAKQGLIAGTLTCALRCNRPRSFCLRLRRSSARFHEKTAARSASAGGRDLFAAS